jgi:hypothetical protein
MNMTFAVRLVSLGACLLIWTGCSRSADRQSLEGTVTLDGAPLANGSIVFLPQSGTKSPTAGGKIADGRFTIAPSGGAASGTFRVEITALRKTGKKAKDPMLGRTIDELVQCVPPCYNRDSQLTANVTEQRTNHFEFTLKSR